MADYLLNPNMPSLNDEEGLRIPDGLPAVIDGHVHVFPHGIFTAVRNWFDEHGWRIRYRLRTEEIFNFLLSRGLVHLVALQYAHKPGIADSLNSYMSQQCSRFPGKITGMATVFPGEEDAPAILQRAFDNGLGGLKLHVHVQCFDINAIYMDPLYDCCLRNNKPLIVHIGREPKSSAYRCDPYTLCSAGKLEAVMKNFPGLKICVPHMGFDEVGEYRKLIEKYDSLWLDTTMTLAGYFPGMKAIDLSRYRTERIIYGSDFPNIPYAWDRELKSLRSTKLASADLLSITHRNCIEFLGLRRDEQS